jgi:hypothetical protein
VVKITQPEEFDLVILGGGTGSTIPAWTFAREGSRKDYRRAGLVADCQKEFNEMWLAPPG